MMLTVHEQDIPECYGVIKQHNKSNAVRLGLIDQTDNSMEEAVLRYQGVLYMYDLPPVVRQARLVF